MFLQEKKNFHGKQQKSKIIKTDFNYLLSYQKFKILSLRNISN